MDDNNGVQVDENKERDADDDGVHVELRMVDVDEEEGSRMSACLLSCDLVEECPVTTCNCHLVSC